MAVGVLVPLPGVTQEIYEHVNRELFGHYPHEPGDGVPGLILHSAGPADDGWYVYDIWESAEEFKQFAESRIGPAMQSVLGGDAQGPEPQFFDVANVFIPG